jgi:hypothetical protein
MEPISNAQNPEHRYVSCRDYVTDPAGLLELAKHYDMSDKIIWNDYFVSVGVYAEPVTEYHSLQGVPYHVAGSL